MGCIKRILYFVVGSLIFIGFVVVSLDDDKVGKVAPVANQAAKREEGNTSAQSPTAGAEQERPGIETSADGQHALAYLRELHSQGKISAETRDKEVKAITAFENGGMFQWLSAHHSVCLLVLDFRFDV